MSFFLAHTRNFKSTTIADKELLNDEDKDVMKVRTKVESEFQFVFRLNSKGKIGRIVCDEVHFIKNPATKGAEAILRLGKQGAWNFWGLSATPMINRVNDLRGLLIQILKRTTLGLRLPTGSAIRNMYKPGYNPYTGLVESQSDNEEEKPKDDEDDKDDDDNDGDEFEPGSIMPEDAEDEVNRPLFDAVDESLKHSGMIINSQRSNNQIPSPRHSLNH